MKNIAMKALFAGALALGTANASTTDTTVYTDTEYAAVVRTTHTTNASLAREALAIDPTATSLEALWTGLDAEAGTTDETNLARDLAATLTSNNGALGDFVDGTITSVIGALDNTVTQTATARSNVSLALMFRVLFNGVNNAGVADIQNVLTGAAAVTVNAVTFPLLATPLDEDSVTLSRLSAAISILANVDAEL